jgi:hypothetical protein
MENEQSMEDPASKLDEDFLTKTTFSKLVEQSCLENQMSYIDTIVYLCEKHNIEVEDSRKYISPALKGKVKAEAMNLNYLPKSNTLPVD